MRDGVRPRRSSRRLLHGVRLESDEVHLVSRAPAVARAKSAVDLEHVTRGRLAALVQPSWSAIRDPGFVSRLIAPSLLRAPARRVRAGRTSPCTQAAPPAWRAGFVCSA